MKNKWNKLLGILLAAVMIVGLSPSAALAEGTITREYGSYAFTKITNPGAGSGEPDGINTNDTTGFDANRLNSYAWAVASRGDSIYIGTNRTLFGSALNALAEMLQKQNPALTPAALGLAVGLVSGGDVPVNLPEEAYIPQIIKVDVKNGTTRVLYQPSVGRDGNGVLRYKGADGAIIPQADVASEAASFRSVVEFNGNLYFGTLGSNLLQLVRIDKDDHADVVFQTIGSYNSLRAGCVYDDGDGETICFGGVDANNPRWREASKTDPSILPIIIRRLDPETAGTDREDWSELIADFEDFGAYAKTKVYVNGGGTVWDLCGFNGKLYLILAYDRGWAMFRGEKGGAKPNVYGWTWTEIVGDHGAYPLAMDEEIGRLNTAYQEAYGCSEESETLNGAGLLESTATPYVYNGKMYIGTFDNATSIQSGTVTKALIKLQKTMGGSDPADTGPTLTQIFAPIYEALSHPQHVWVMDADEKITAADGANALLNGTTNDYVWRFFEHDGKLYAGTFDSATAFQYFLDFRIGWILEMLKKSGFEFPPELRSLMDDSFLGQFLELLDDMDGGAHDSPAAATLRAAVTEASEAVRDFLNDGGTTVGELLAAMEALEAARNAAPEDGQDALIPEQAMAMIDWLLRTIDTEGLRYWAKARALVRNGEGGFDILVTDDGEAWETVVRDGLGDPYNYGARTFAEYDGELYVGTANPYYGAQLWKITYNGDGTAGLPERFRDLDPEAWYEKDVEFTVKRGLMAGVADDLFGPNEETTRAMIVTVLYRLEGEPEVSGASPFDDVDEGRWYTDAILWAQSNHIAVGYGNGRFGPGNAITREQLATILYRYAQYKGFDVSVGNVDAVSFFDASEISDWAMPAIRWACGTGMMLGDDQGKLLPGSGAARAQAAALIHRFAEKMMG